MTREASSAWRECNGYNDTRQGRKAQHVKLKEAQVQIQSISAINYKRRKINKYIYYSQGSKTNCAQIDFCRYSKSRIFKQ